MKFRIQREGETLEHWKLYIQTTLRKHYNDGKLSTDEISACRAKGIDFRTLDEKWMDYFNLGKIDKFTNLKDKELKKWVNRQRRKKLDGIMQLWEEDLLNNAGFKWSVEDIWDSLLNEYKDHDAQITKPRKLAHWVQRQKRNFRDGKLTAERIQKLNEANFSFEIKMRRKNFEDGVKQLQDFRNTHGKEPRANSTDKLENSIGNWRGTNHLKLKKLGIYNYKKED